MDIGRRIKNRRLELGLSVDEVAARIGKNRATVYRYESSDIENLPTSILEPLAKALQASFSIPIILIFPDIMRLFRLFKTNQTQQKPTYCV